MLLLLSSINNLQMLWMLAEKPFNICHRLTKEQFLVMFCYLIYTPS